MNGVKSKLQAVGDAKFVEDVVQVIFDSLFADEELSPDLFIPIALRHQLHDLFFAIAQQRLIPPRPVSELLAKAFMTSAVMRLSSQISPP